MDNDLRKEYLICYDVEENKPRTKIHKELKKFGMRPVQKSVFWGYLTRAELDACRRFIEKWASSDDKAIFLRSSFNARGYSYFIGHDKNEFTDWDVHDVI